MRLLNGEAYNPFLFGLACFVFFVAYIRIYIFKEEGMEGKKKFRPNSDLKLMDQVREVLRYHHYAYRTEQTYCDWIKRRRGQSYKIMIYSLPSNLAPCLRRF